MPLHPTQLAKLKDDLAAVRGEVDELKHQIQSARDGIRQLLNHSNCKLYVTDPALYYALYYWVTYMGQK